MPCRFTAPHRTELLQNEGEVPVKRVAGLWDQIHQQVTKATVPGLLLTKHTPRAQQTYRHGMNYRDAFLHPPNTKPSPKWVVRLP
jgi:hypothetical protein